jgi:uncharacterized protein
MPPDAAIAATPRPTISVDGQEQAGLAQGLLAMRVAEEAEGMASCELSLGNWGAQAGETGYLYFDRRLLDLGKPLVVKLGGETIFDGRITALEGHYPEGSPPVLTVLAEDRLQDLRMTRRSRSWEQASDADMLQQIASDHGLTPDIQAQGPTHAALAQVERSDLAFARERARAIGAELWVEGSTLKARSRSDRAGGRPVRLRYGHELYELTIGADLAHQRTAVEVTGWDVAGKSALRERATGSVVSGETGGGTSGPDALASALGDRVDVVAGAVPLTSSEAHAHAEALMRARARRFVTGRGIPEANPKLRAGATVSLDGVGPLFDGDAYLAAVVHRFDGIEGLRTEIALERPGLGGAA